MQPASPAGSFAAVMNAPVAPAIIWFREDLRCSDNPALSAAVATGRPVLCVYIRDPGQKPGGASRWWLAGSLRALDRALSERGARLDILEGEPDELLPRLVERSGASHVHWNRRYDARGIATDTALKSRLRAMGVEAASCNGHLLHEPWEVRSKAGGPMRVFTPFWRAARARGEPALPLPAPARITPAEWPDAPDLARSRIDALGLEPTAPDWAVGLRESWTPGESGAAARLLEFLDTALAGYAANRNRPDMAGTSRLSPHLRFGEISVRQVWHAAQNHALIHPTGGEGKGDLDTFLAELGWREFSYHLLHTHPDLNRRNFQPRFDAFPWRDDPGGLKAWQRGQTGYPIVDAGMRQLWHTGWMHNRVRMIAASFLIKHLLIDWRLGEKWFWDTLVDADPASNAASWQWVAGSGADAAPYFRVFNPVLQGEKFDPDGAYVRQWVPELARLPGRFIHKPWLAPSPVRKAAGLAQDVYPAPIVDHDAARARALAAFDSLRLAA